MDQFAWRALLEHIGAGTRGEPPAQRGQPGEVLVTVAEQGERLEDIRDRGLYRRMRCVSGPQGPRVLLDGKPVLVGAALIDEIRAATAATECAT